MSEKIWAVLLNFFKMCAQRNIDCFNWLTLSVRCIWWNWRLKMGSCWLVLRIVFSVALAIFSAIFSNASSAKRFNHSPFPVARFACRVMHLSRDAPVAKRSGPPTSNARSFRIAKVARVRAARLAYSAEEGSGGRRDVSREEGRAKRGWIVWEVGWVMWYNRAYGFIYCSNIFPFPHYRANDIPSLVQ